MTGYSAVRHATALGELTVSLRSVNHRGLDLHFHHSSELAAFENAMRSVLKAGLRRGHVEIRASLARDAQTGNGAYNKELLSRYIAAFQRAAADLNLDSKPDLNTFLTMPGILETSQPKSLDASFEAEIVKAFESCVDSLNDYRQREGHQLAQHMLQESAEIKAHVERIKEIRAQAVPLFQQRMLERMKDLLAQSSISESRLAEEAALLADKSDVQEELTRLTVHLAELRSILESGGEVGKRLDFLLQEMNRETNTILSKTSGIGDTGLTVSAAALAIKANIERIREQALNLE